jgi:hypothetical protein
VNKVLECEQRTAGHCWHAVEVEAEAYEECCCCPARRNERVIGVQGGLL